MVHQDRRIPCNECGCHQGSIVNIREQKGIVSIGEIEINFDLLEVRKGGVPISLSPLEFQLLFALADKTGEVVSSKELLARVWGPGYVDAGHYLRGYIRNLRQKLEEDPSQPKHIVTRWGSGYALVEPVGLKVAVG